MGVPADQVIGSPTAGIVATVQRSPDAVAAHDFAAWSGLFARGAVLEDPVGTPPVVVPDTGDVSALAGFYETFIAPNDVRFDVHADYVDGDTLLRDATIHIRFGTGVQIQVPAYVLYQVCSQGGQQRIHRLQAHWELRKLVPTILAHGLAGWKTMITLTATMLRAQGLVASMGFSRGYVFGVFESGKRRLAQLIRDANGHRSVSGPAGPLSTLVAEKGAVYVDRAVSAGYVTAARLHRVDDARQRPSIILADFSAGNPGEPRVRIFS